MVQEILHTFSQLSKGRSSQLVSHPYPTIQLFRQARCRCRPRGKTTANESLSLLFHADGLSFQAISIDDFYLPASWQEEVG